MQPTLSDLYGSDARSSLVSPLSRTVWQHPEGDKERPVERCAYNESFLGIQDLC